MLCIQYTNTSCSWLIPLQIHRESLLFVVLKMWQSLYFFPECHFLYMAILHLSHNSIFILRTYIETGLLACTF